jgi:serine protease Do
LRLTRFDGPNVFSWNILRDTKTPHYKPGDWNTIRVQVEEERLRCYVNDELVIESTDQSWREGRAGLAKFRDTRAQFRDFYLGPVRAHSKPEQNVAPLAMEALGRPEWTKSVATNAPGGRKQLLAAADKLDTQAQQLRRTAQLLHERDTIERLQLELSRPKAESSLFNAALLVAKLDNPDLELAEYHAELKHLSEELKASLPAAANDDAKVDALTRFLFVTNGFHGSRGDYYNPANSYVNAVLDDREGLPITLAVIYLELARSIGLTNAFCVPVPTHFMVMFRPTNGRERIIDVFNQGRSLTRSEAVELVAENAEVVGEEAFEPATGRDIVVRMLRNLLGIAQRESDADKSLRYLNALIAIAPESAADRLARARLHLQQRSVSEAKEDLRWLLDRAPDGLDLDRVAELYRSL